MADQPFELAPAGAECEVKDLDQFWTPPWPTLALLENLGELGPKPTDTILEPCAGANGITSVLRSKGLLVNTGDIDPEMVERYGHHYTWDYASPPKSGGWDWGITNPPFNQGTAIVRRLLAECTRVAVLLRCTWGEPCLEEREPWEGRASLFDLDPPSRMIWIPRPTFGLPSGSFKGSTDSATCCWFIWGTPSNGGTETFWVHPRDVWRHVGQLALDLMEVP